MSVHRFAQVDAFTARPFHGNPVAVVLDADDLDGEAMQRIAAWTNLSETTFVLTPTVAPPAYRVRIFTPQHELPFAGHPTVGTCHAVLEAGRVEPADGRLVQECGAGNLELRIEGAGPERSIFVAAPPARFTVAPPDLAPRLSAALGAEVAARPAPAAFANGPNWLFALLGTDELRALAPDLAAIAALSRELDVSGVAAFALRDGDPVPVHIRCFAPLHGVAEDPVTGSANAALPAYLAHHGLLDRVGADYVATQGTELGRDGRVQVRVLDHSGRAEIGGQAVTVVRGEIYR